MAHGTREYSVKVQWDGDSEEYIASVPEFPYVTASGRTRRKALDDLHSALELAVASMDELGRALPEPRVYQQRSGQLRLRLPRSLHERLAEAADEEGVSLNQLIIALVSEAFGIRHGEVRAGAKARGCTAAKTVKKQR